MFNYLCFEQISIHPQIDASEIERRQLAMDAHRRKLQEEHDRKAAEHAARQAEVRISHRLKLIAICIKSPSVTQAAIE